MLTIRPYGYDRAVRFNDETPGESESIVERPTVSNEQELPDRANAFLKLNNPKGRWRATATNLKFLTMRPPSIK
jgi:hypothetical protein